MLYCKLKETRLAEIPKVDFTGNKHLPHSSLKHASTFLLSNMLDLSYQLALASPFFT